MNVDHLAILHRILAELEIIKRDIEGLRVHQGSSAYFLQSSVDDLTKQVKLLLDANRN